MGYKQRLLRAFIDVAHPAQAMYAMGFQKHPRFIALVQKFGGEDRLLTKAGRFRGWPFNLRQEAWDLLEELVYRQDRPSKFSSQQLARVQ